MSNEKPGRYVIFGAGAIGSAIAALLVRAGSRVVCVARPAYAEALRRGIVIKENGEELAVSVDAVTAARDAMAARAGIGKCLGARVVGCGRRTLKEQEDQGRDEYLTTWLSHLSAA